MQVQVQQTNVIAQRSSPVAVKEEEAVIEVEAAQRQPCEANAFLPLSTIRLSEDQLLPMQQVAMPSTHVSFSSTTSPLMSVRFWQSSPQVMPYMGAFANTPNMLSRGSPSAFSPRLGAMTDFGSMYLRAMLNLRNQENPIGQLPSGYRIPESLGPSPTDAQRFGLNLPK